MVAWSAARLGGDDRDDQPEEPRQQRADGKPALEDQPPLRVIRDEQGRAQAVESACEQRPGVRQPAIVGLVRWTIARGALPRSARRAILLARGTS
jgi:hypothetical protein